VSNFQGFPEIYGRPLFLRLLTRHTAQEIPSRTTSPYINTSRYEDDPGETLITMVLRAMDSITSVPYQQMAITDHSHIAK
jgi:hypothetical protein